MKEYVDKEFYAEVIAGYIIGISATETCSGNYHISFGEINGYFGTNLPEDKEMLDNIKDAILKKGDIVSDLNTDEDFDIMIFTSFCPCVDDEDDE